MATKWRRIIRGLGVFTISAFFIAALTPASNIIGQHLAVADAVQPSDAIVVLGAGLMRAGILQEESMRRVVRGVELHKQGLAPLLILLGPAPKDRSGPTEAEVRANFARAMGVSPGDTIKVEALTTREESRNVASLLRLRDVHRVIVVTESLHMRRAKLVFERAGFEVWPGISTHYPAAVRGPADRLWLALRVVQESAALIYYRVAGYI